MLSEQIMKSSPFSRVIVSVSTVVILAIAVYNWAVSPHTKYLHAAEKYQTMADNVEKKTRSLKKVVSIKEKKLESLKQELIEFKTAFFTPSEGVEFFSGLEPIAEKTGCNIKLMTFGSARSMVIDESDTDSDMITVKIATLQYTGKYARVTRFLKYLNDYPKRVAVSNLRIKSPSNSDTILDCKMNITIYITENKEPATDAKK
jgi:Tfp pilus assembly protein PilO